MNLKDYVKDVKNFPKKGIDFKDITPMLQDPKAFKEVIKSFKKLIVEKNIEFDYIVGLDSRGFLFGTPLAMETNKGFVPIRKKGKLPRETIQKKIVTEYSKDVIEIHKEDLKKGDKIILIDDLLATGGSMAASIELIERLEAEIQHIFFVIELPELAGSKKMKDYPVSSLLTY